MPTQGTDDDSCSVELTEIPWVSEYGGDVSSVLPSAAESALWNALSPSVHCIFDNRLTLAARHHAAALLLSPSVDGSDADQLRFTLQKLGSYDYKITSINGYIGESPAETKTASFLRAVESAQDEWTHCGLGVAFVQDRRSAVWIGVDRTLEIQPFPVTVAVGTSPSLMVHAERYAQSSVRLYVGQPDTSVIPVEPSLRSRAGLWKFEIPVTAAGRTEVELLQDVGSGPETVLLVPIFAEVSPDTRPRIFAEAHSAAKLDPEQTLLSLLNRARKKVGLAGLVRDERLDQVAQKHSEDMKMTGFFGHRSPNFGPLSKRLAAFHIAPTRTGENIASGVSAFRIHHKLMESPAHRINMLNPGFSHVGIGAAKSNTILLGTEIYATW